MIAGIPARAAVLNRDHMCARDVATREDALDATDLDRWIEAYGDEMYRYALLRLRDAHAAEDVVHDALVAGIRSAAGFEGRSSEKTWLIGILRHKVLDAMRAASRDREWTSSVRASVDGHVSLPARDRRDWGRIAPEEQSEFRAAVWKAIAALPDPMRQAFCLKEIDGLSGPEICEALSISQTNLWTLVHRAKLRLRTDLAEVWGSRE